MKRTARKIKREIRWIIYACLLFFALGSFLIKELSAVSSDIPSEETLVTEKEETTEISELEVHFIDVGQGDCILVLCDGHAMLIDAGDNSKGTTVQFYLQKRGIETLDYVVGTHPHADHIGGLDVIITKFDCGKIIMPEYATDKKTYRDVIDAMEYRSYEKTVPQVGDTYTLGGAEFTIVASPQFESNKEINNYSIGIHLTHGNNTFLFMGDAEKEEETEVLNSGMNIQSNTLKISHHGSHTSTSSEFLDEVNPDYAVISCAENNDYGYPHAEILIRLRKAGIKVFRTDEQGSIIATSDGRQITFNAEPSNTWQTGR